VLTTIASSAVRSENSIPGRRSFLQSHRGALMGAFSRPASHRVGPTIVLFLAYLFAPGRHPASVTTGGSAIARGAITRGEEERIAENCPACGGLVECGRTKGKQRTRALGCPGHYLHRPRKPRHTRAAGRALQKLIDECCCK
jgi:hypothetical protein